MATRVDFETKTGARAPGEIVEPAGTQTAPGVVLLQEYWGVNDHIRSLLDRLAAAGFVALAPDLYHGTVCKTAAEAQQAMRDLDWARAVDEVAGAARYLAAHPRCTGRVGVVGFCMGGALALMAAQQGPELGAVVSFYGLRGEVDPARVRAPVMAHVASRDGWVKPELVRKIAQDFREAGRTMEVHEYDADHAFVNDTRPEVHDPAAARQAWARTVEFFRRHLG